MAEGGGLDPVAEKELLAEPFSYPAAARHIVGFAVPLSLSFMAQCAVMMLGVMTAGRFGVAPLGAAGLAYSFINATAFSVSTGFCGALDTFLSHSFGRDPASKQFGTYAQRMVILLLVLSFPVAALFSFVDVLGRAAGQDPDVVRYLATFMRTALVGLVPFMLLEVVKRYYQAQHVTTPLAVATAAAALVINPALVALLVFVAGAGFVAVPLSWSLLHVVLLAGLVAYLWRSGMLARTWGGWDEDALRNWGPMLRVGGLSFAMIVSEWVVIEVNVMAAGLSTPIDLAGFSIANQFALFSWNVTAGYYSALGMLVGTFIGAGQPDKARRYAFTGVAMTFATALVDSSILMLFGRYGARLYTDDAAVIEAFLRVAPCAAFFHLFDSTQSALLGVFRGCGLQNIGAVAVTLSYLVVGMPLGWVLCFYFGFGVPMLFLGGGIGAAVVGVPICVTALYRLDWAKIQAHSDSPSSPSQASPSGKSEDESAAIFKDTQKKRDVPTPDIV